MLIFEIAVLIIIFASFISFVINGVGLSVCMVMGGLGVMDYFSHHYILFCLAFGVIAALLSGLAFLLTPKCLLLFWCLAITGLTMLFIGCMQRATKRIQLENDVIKAKEIEKEMAFYGNALSFFGVAFPLFIEAIAKDGEPGKTLAMLLAILALAFFLYFSRYYSGIVWEHMSCLERRERKINENK